MTEKPKLSAVARVQHTSDETLAAMHAMVDAAAKQGQVVGALLVVEHVSVEDGVLLGKPKVYSVPVGDFAVRGLIDNAWDEVNSEFEYRFYGKREQS